MAQEQRLLYSTLSQVAQDLGVPPHTVRHILQTRGIQETGWVGHTRIFDRETVARIGAAAAEISRDPRGAKARARRQAAGR